MAILCCLGMLPKCCLTLYLTYFHHILELLVCDSASVTNEISPNRLVFLPKWDLRDFFLVVLIMMTRALGGPTRPWRWCGREAKTQVWNMVVTKYESSLLIKAFIQDFGYLKKRSKYYARVFVFLFPVHHFKFTSFFFYHLSIPSYTDT